MLQAASQIQGLLIPTYMKCSLVLFQTRYSWWTEKELGRAASSIPGPVSCHGYSPKESAQRTYGSWNETARKRHWNHWETQNYLHWRYILDEGLGFEECCHLLGWMLSEHRLSVRFTGR